MADGYFRVFVLQIQIIRDIPVLHIETSPSTPSVSMENAPPDPQPAEVSRIGPGVRLRALGTMIDGLTFSRRNNAPAPCDDDYFVLGSEKLVGWIEKNEVDKLEEVFGTIPTPGGPHIFRINGDPVDNKKSVRRVEDWMRECLVAAWGSGVLVKGIGDRFAEETGDYEVAKNEFEAVFQRGRREFTTWEEKWQIKDPDVKGYPLRFRPWVRRAYRPMI